MKSLLICLGGMALASLAMEPAVARARHHHGHGMVHRKVYTPERASSRTYDIVAGSNKVRINGVGQVITNRRP